MHIVAAQCIVPLQFYNDYSSNQKSLPKTYCDSKKQCLSLPIIFSKIKR